MAGFLINRKPQIIDLAILGNKVELIMTSESLPAPPAPLGRSASQIWHLNGVKCRSVRSKVIRWEPSLQGGMPQPFLCWGKQKGPVVLVIYRLPLKQVLLQANIAIRSPSKLPKWGYKFSRTGSAYRGWGFRVEGCLCLIMTLYPPPFS